MTLWNSYSQKTGTGFAVGQDRQTIVNQALSGWTNKLIDLSRKNNLLYFRTLKKGTLNLSQHHAEIMVRLLAGHSVSLASLLATDDITPAVMRLKSIRKNALTYLEEKGLQTLFLALGMATWEVTDGGRPPEAAVLLVPISIGHQGRGYQSFTLQRSGDIQLNPVLLHVLKTEHGCEIDAEELLPETSQEDECFDPTPIYDQLKKAAHSVKGLTIKQSAHISNFYYQKMSLVEELSTYATQIADHDLIAAITGYKQARESIRQGVTEINPREFDKIPPKNEFMILDADSSQQRVIAAVLSGQHGVIQGPPGTGKSQTIANLIAALTAKGQRVLFVAEKRAALEVVYRRLEQTGLGHLALDLHGTISRPQIMERLGKALTEVRDSIRVDAKETHRIFTDRRQSLNDHVSRLHKPRSPSGMSVYELQGHILQLPAEAKLSTRWRGKALAPLNAENARTIRELLTEVGGFQTLFLRSDSSPWMQAHLPNKAAVQTMYDLVLRLHGEHWPNLYASLDTITAHTGLRRPTSLIELGSQLDLLSEIRKTLAIYSPELFSEDLDGMEKALSAGKGTLSGAFAWWFNRGYRQARRRAQELRGEKVSAPQIYREIHDAQEQQRRWRKLSSDKSPLGLFPELESYSQQYQALIVDLQSFAQYLRQELIGLPLDDSFALITSFAADSVTPYRLMRVMEIEEGIEKCGGKAILTPIKQSGADPSLWAQMFDFAWLASCLDQVHSSESALAGFNGQTHNKIVKEFTAKDKKRLELARGRVRRRHAEKAIAAMNAEPEQEALLRRETQKKRRLLPIRKLLARAPDVLLALCPCWMASPLSVNQLLDLDRRYFDVVIFDEASQILPQDAIAAIMRASQVVVAGDKHQLPPTTFFVSTESEEDQEDEPAPTAGLESLLDLMSSFLTPWSLEWHYRSRDEALIAFSNRHIYNNRLVTFPSTGDGMVIRHELVDHIPRDDKEKSPVEEVKRVVELVLEHATKRRHETLGVITMGLKHATRIEAALERELQERDDEDLERFFEQSQNDRFFIKSLENVQGDERDAMILSIGYGKDRSGGLPYRFGPLLQEGGERRLNVAITRARHRMTVVSSFSHHDMDPSRSNSRGVELLRLYLQYAASNGTNLGDSGQSNVPMNPFEQDVYNALTAKGIALLPQWGVSRYRLDFAAKHPQKPGSFVLAIECDGATYHSSPTARDRDRLRQQHLEGLGWRFHRIWSTDWFMGREKEIERTVTAWKQAVALADQEDKRRQQMKDDVKESTAQKSTSSEHQAPKHLLKHEVNTHKRGRRPNVPNQKSIKEYSDRELDQLVRWIKSDGQLRTNEEIITEMILELGFKRRGPRIVEAIEAAIERTREK